MQVLLQHLYAGTAAYVTITSHEHGSQSWERCLVVLVVQLAVTIVKKKHKEKR